MKTDAWKLSMAANEATHKAFRCDMEGKAIEDAADHIIAADGHKKACSEHYRAMGNAKADGDGLLAWQHERAASFHDSMARDHKAMAAASIGAPSTDIYGRMAAAVSDTKAA